MNTQRSSSIQLLSEGVMSALMVVNCATCSFGWALNVRAIFGETYTPPQVDIFVYRNACVRAGMEGGGEGEEKVAESNIDGLDSTQVDGLDGGDTEQATGPGDRGQEDDQGPKPTKKVPSNPS